MKEPTPRPRRVLFMVEAVTLAHPARCGVLAQALCRDPALEVFFACDERYEFCLPRGAVKRLPLHSISSQHFLDALAAGKPVYSYSLLEDYVTQDLTLIDQVKPDLIVADFRLSLAVSAARRGVPVLNLTNAHWSKYSTVRRYPVPELPITRLLGVKAAQCCFDLLRPFFFYLNVLPVNRLRRRHGLAPFDDAGEAYSFGDYVAYLDLPSLEPMASLPATHRFIGPVWWSPKRAPDAALDAFLQSQPLVYITLGSSGDAQLLPHLLEIVCAMPVYALVATAGRSGVVSPGANVRVVDYADGDRVARHARLMVCNGGNATLNQALAAGIPVLGIPSNLDQFMTMAAVQQAGAGLMLRSGELRPRLRPTLQCLLQEPRFALAAQRLRQEIEAHDSRQLFCAFVHQILSQTTA